MNAYEPDYEKYPMFKYAKSLDFDQKAGDLLVIPTGWFHQVRYFKNVESLLYGSFICCPLLVSSLAGTEYNNALTSVEVWHAAPGLRYNTIGGLQHYLNMAGVA